MTQATLCPRGNVGSRNKPLIVGNRTLAERDLAEGQQRILRQRHV